ncbi:MAG: hypothetical protein IJ887_17390 [Prevotella sp.]|nr:hypothetical protein [Prevotella sp.]
MKINYNKMQRIVHLLAMLVIFAVSAEGQVGRMSYKNAFTGKLNGKRTAPNWLINNVAVPEGKAFETNYMIKKSSKRKAPINNIDKLTGPAVVWGQSILNDINYGGNACNVTKLNSTTLQIEHFTENATNKITVNVNLQDGTFSIPAGQVLHTDPDYGNVILVAAPRGTFDENAPITGYIDDEGDMIVDTRWGDSFFDSEEGEYYIYQGAYHYSEVVFANGTMSCRHSDGSGTDSYPVRIHQEGNTVLVVNFGGNGCPVNIDINEDKTIKIPSQVCWDIQPTTYQNSPIDDFYSFAADWNSNKWTTSTIDGTITSKEIRFGNWGILDKTENWTLGKFSDGIIQLTSNDSFVLPGGPKSVLTVGDLEITEGGTADLVVNMDYDTSEKVVGYNFSLYLPDGVEVAKDDDGDFIAEASSELHSYSLRQGLDIIETTNGGYLFVCFKDNIPMTGTHGKLVTIKLKATNASGGTATIKDIGLTNEKAVSLDFGNLKDVEFYVNVVKANPVDFENNMAVFTLYPGSKTATIKSVKALKKDVEMPSTVEYNGEQYTVSAIGYQALASGDGFNYSVSLPSTITTIEAGAFDNAQTSAIIWNSNTPLPYNAFDKLATNRENMLLYVSKSGIAPSGFANTIVNGVAQNIQLKEGHLFHCPQEFTARNISFTHEFTMETVVGKRQGWETIALPFDVQTITHATKGYLIPFASYSPSSSEKPFWLYEWTDKGFAKASAMVANKPYIISMPNNTAYSPDYNLAGEVTFAATNAQVRTTFHGDILSKGYNNKYFFASYYYKMDGDSYPNYSINSVNNLHSYAGGYDPGSIFIRIKNLRNAFPFEGFIQDQSIDASSRSVIEIEFAPDEDETQGIESIMPVASNAQGSGVYSVSGQYLGDDEKNIQPLPSGVYIVNGKKKVVR